MKHIISNFVHPEDAKSFITFFENNDLLCSDPRDFHKERNLHYKDITDKKIKILLIYYAHKNKFFIDHYFKTKTDLWNDMRLCRWKVGHSMPLHMDRQPELNDTMDFSSLIYLNDNYSGGELRFIENKKEVNYKMESLSCIIFPSDEGMHGVKEIKKGERYTIPSWYKKN